MKKTKLNKLINDVKFLGEKKSKSKYVLSYSIPEELIPYLIKVYGDNYDEEMNKDFNKWLETIVSLHKIGGDELVKEYIKDNK